MDVEHFDVVVVGAGISGIGAGYFLQKESPNRSYVILEGRDDMGGTWDLFRYPGVRSDSDMHTLGYSFKPWTAAKSIADGPNILAYLRETASEFGIDKNIRFKHLVTKAEWSSERAQWTVTATQKDSNAIVTYTCNFLFIIFIHNMISTDFTFLIHIPWMHSLERHYHHKPNEQYICMFEPCFSRISTVYTT